MMLSGIDISHHNEAYIMKNPTFFNDQDFIILKASEGIHYRDPWMKRYLSMIDPEKLIGFYHYARPEKGNLPEAEAFHFLQTIKGYEGKAILALDVEADALLYHDIDGWVYKWLSFIYETTKVKPLVYCSESQCHRFTQAAENDFGLWVAKWGKTKPAKTKIKPWTFYAIHQYQVFGVDRDYFNGDAEAWTAYAKGGRS